jgi:hypothetical protein
MMSSHRFVLYLRYLNLGEVFMAYKQSIRFNRDYLTRDGCTVHIITTCLKGEYPVVGLVTKGGPKEELSWSRTGRYDNDVNKDNPYDLVKDITE